MAQKTLLMILDGWGNAPDPKISALDQAQTPYIDSLYKNYASNTLRTDGVYVGLPEGQMGNSEVGHMNLGAGRIVYQDLAKINLAVESQELKNEKVLIECFEYAKKKRKKVHVLGLLSDGGVHSHIKHLEGIIDLIEDYELPQVYLHAFTDGRDVDPKSGKKFVNQIENKLQGKHTKFASLIGRYYAMDRDERWERVKLAYELLVHRKGSPSSNFEKSLQKSYDQGITDEFIKPIYKENILAKIEQGDVVLFFNFRTDRGREITRVLSQHAFPKYEMKPLDLYYVTLTNYDESFKGVKVVFDKDNLQDTLGEVLAKAGKTQVRIAETEKYPHVTFFFNGGREVPFDGEERILCPSPKVATYDLKPEMSAFEIRDAIIKKIENDPPDFICLNFANPDMVGHTGNLNATLKACETIDRMIGRITSSLDAVNGEMLIISDHGNCEEMFIQGTSKAHTYHTLNPVPVILYSKRENLSLSPGKLSDVAPTVLDLMGLEKPKLISLTCN